MEPKEFLAFLARLEKLKCNTRHSWTSSGRHESVAEHSWRLAMLAMLLRDALPEVDMDKVLRMCLIHDVGEAVTGDIPSFQKTDANDETERQAIAELLSPLPDGLRGELTALFAEMDALATPEARVYKALDKLEVVVQHNEAPWTPGCPWSTSSTRPMAFLRLPPSRPWRLCGSRPDWIPWPSWQKNPADADASAGFRAIPLRRRAAAACPVPPPRSPAAGPRAAPPLQPPDCHTGSGG